MKKCRENFKGIRQRFDAFVKLQTVNAVDREKFGKNFELFELLVNSILFSISTHIHTWSSYREFRKLFVFRYYNNLFPFWWVFKLFHFFCLLNYHQKTTFTTLFFHNISRWNRESPIGWKTQKRGTKSADFLSDNERVFYDAVFRVEIALTTLRFHEFELETTSFWATQLN